MLTDEKLGVYDTLRRELALALWDVGSVLTQDMSHPLVVKRGEERGFLFPEHQDNPSLPLSPYFFNFRTKDDPRPGLLTHEVMTMAVRCMYETAKRHKLAYDGIAGLPPAGVPFVQAYHKLHARFPVVKLEQEEKANGARGDIKIASGTPRARNILVLNDVITSADSKFKAIKALENWSFRAMNTLVLVDCEQGGAVELAAKGYSLWSVFSVTELFRFYVEERRVPEALLDTLKGYRSRMAG